MDILNLALMYGTLERLVTRNLADVSAERVLSFPRWTAFNCAAMTATISQMLAHALAFEREGFRISRVIPIFVIFGRRRHLHAFDGSFLGSTTAFHIHLLGARRAGPNVTCLGTGMLATVQYLSANLRAGWNGIQTADTRRSEEEHIARSTWACQHVLREQLAFSTVPRMALFLAAMIAAFQQPAERVSGHAYQLSTNLSHILPHEKCRSSPMAVSTESVPHTLSSDTFPQ